MRALVSGVFLIAMSVAAVAVSVSADPAPPPPPPGAADIRAFRECQNTQIRKLDDRKRAPELVAKDLAAHCERAYEAMAAAVLKMFGKPAWMSNYDSSMATVQAYRSGELPPN